MTDADWKELQRDMEREEMITRARERYRWFADGIHGESYIGLIEELEFRNATPSDKRFTGYGGLLLVTIRTV